MRYVEYAFGEANIDIVAYEVNNVKWNGYNTHVR